MKNYLVMLSFLIIACTAYAETPLLFSDSLHVQALAARDDFYCQVPEYIAVYNASSGFESEIADDIPDAFAGQVVEQVTFWVGEWSGAWQDPTGVTVNFYQGACPPAMDSTQSFMIPWSEWETELVYTGIAVVYRATATLPSPVALETGMSIGGYVNTTWAHEEPFAGLCATPEWAISGCGEAYLDAEWWGYTRWTETSHYTQIPRDFAYCLGGNATVEAAVTCVPGFGVVPFVTNISVSMNNLLADQLRRVSARIDLTLADSSSYTNWRAGWTNLSPGENYVTAWNQTLPALGAVLGSNVFTLIAEDVTPSPYNLPPYAPSGGTSVDTCTVVGMSP